MAATRREFFARALGGACAALAAAYVPMAVTTESAKREVRQRYPHWKNETRQYERVSKDDLVHAFNRGMEQLSRSMANRSEDALWADPSQSGGMQTWMLT